MNNLYQMDRYVAPYEYLINFKILEYDIEKANISILRDTGVLTESQYFYFLNMVKQQREISIGYMIKNKPKISLILKEGIMKARKIFIEKNNIEPKDILFINNDSITLVYNEWDKRSINIDGNISDITHFRLKNSYTSFYKLPYIDFLYFNNGNKEYYRLKNIDQERIERDHKKYFLSILTSIAFEAQTSPILDIILMIRNIYELYTGMKLELEFYREFNTMNKYKIKNISDTIEYYTDTLDYGNINNLNINYNADIIRHLYKIFITEYFKNIK